MATGQLNEEADVSPPEPAAPTPSLNFFRSPREATLLIALLLALLTLALYEPSLHNGFINFDDPDYVTANARVRQGLSMSNLHWAFTTVSSSNWFPLTWIAYMADVQVFGLNPTGHHLASLFWHTLNVILLFLLLRRACGYVLRSAIVAALFAVFPLNVEAVAWVAELKTLLSTTCLLAALFAYGWYVQKRSVGRYLAVVTLFALGLTAKAMIITLPLLLLLVDVWPFGRLAHGVEPPLRHLWWLVAEKIPLLLLSVASAAITLYAARRGGTLSPTALRPMSLRIENAVWSYVAYLGKGLWPLDLAVIYPFPDRAAIGPLKIAAATFVLAGISWLVWRYRNKPYLVSGWLWFLVVLVPVSGIAQAGPQAMADRYAYTSFWGIFIIATWTAAEWAKRIRLPAGVLAAVTTLALGGYAWSSHLQIGYWHDSYSVFSHAIAVTPRNGIAEENLGVALLGAGQPDSAMPHLERAIQYLPDFPTAHFNLGTLLQNRGRVDEARREYELTLEYTGDPNEAARAYNNLGMILLGKNDLQPALREYNAALRLNPEEPHSLLGRGTIEYRNSQLDAALADLTKSARLSASPTTYLVMGRVYEDKGNIEAAAKCYQAALTLDPKLAGASSRLSALAHGATR